MALALELIDSIQQQAGSAEERAESVRALQNYVLGLINQNHQLWQAFELLGRQLGVNHDNLTPGVSWESEVLRALAKVQLEKDLLCRVVGHKTLAAPKIGTGLSPDEEMEIRHLLV